MLREDKGTSEDTGDIAKISSGEDGRPVGDSMQNDELEDLRRGISMGVEWLCEALQQKVRV